MYATNARDKSDKANLNPIFETINKLSSEGYTKFQTYLSQKYVAHLKGLGYIIEEIETKPGKRKNLYSISWDNDTICFKVLGKRLKFPEFKNEELVIIKIDIDMKLSKPFTIHLFGKKKPIKNVGFARMYELSDQQDLYPHILRMKRNSVELILTDDS